MAQEFVHKVDHFSAVQYPAPPAQLPPNIETIDGAPWLVITDSIKFPIHDTDWIVVNLQTGEQLVMSDANFKNNYSVATGPR